MAAKTRRLSSGTISFDTNVSFVDDVVKVTTTDLTTKDRLITLNKGGTLGGNTSGIEVESGGSIVATIGYTDSGGWNFGNRNITTTGTVSGSLSLSADSVNDTHIDFGTGANQVNTDDLPEGSSNLYYTDARADARATLRINAATTDNIDEGSTNLYYTDARVDARITNAGQTPVTGSDLDMNGNKVLFANVYPTTGDLPSASTYHGMFAHVHAEGKGYYAHAGNWVKLADFNDVPTNNNQLTNGAGYVTTDTTYTAGNGLSLSGANEFSMSGSYTGSFTATGDITAYSDKRLKRNIETITNAVDTVSKLRGVNYEKDGRNSTGVIAQEIEEVLPQVVHTDADGMKSVAYGNIVGILIEAIKEQQKEIEELKKKL